MPQIYSLSYHNNLVREINAVITGGSGGCTPVPALDELPKGQGGWIAKQSYLKNHGLRAGPREMRNSMDAYAAANGCDPLEWVIPLTIIRTKIFDEIRANLARLQNCDCDCCHPDDEGEGSFEILASGDIDNQDSDYTGGPGEVNFAHVIAGHAFSVPTFQAPGGTLVSELMTPTPGKLSEEWILSIEVHRISDDTWHSASISNFCSCGECGNTADAEVPFSVFSNFPGGGPPDDYDHYRLTMIHGTTADLCDDCTDDPKPHCGDGG